MAVINTTTKDILQTFQSAYYEQIGRKMVIGSEEYTLASIFSYVLAVYSGMLNASYNNRFLSTANGQFLDDVASQYSLDRTPVVFENPYFDGSFLFNNPDGRTYHAGDYVITLAGYHYTNTDSFTMSAANTPIKWRCTESHSEYLTKAEIESALVGEGKVFYSVAQLSDGLQSVEAPITDDDAFRAYIEQNKRIYQSGIAESFESVARLASERIVDAHCIRQSEAGFEAGKVSLQIKTLDGTTNRNIVNRFDVPTIEKAISDLNLLCVGQSLQVNVLPYRNFSITGMTVYISPEYIDNGQSLVDAKCAACKYWINNHLKITDPIYPGAIIDFLKTPLREFSTNPADFNMTTEDYDNLGDFCIIDGKSADLTRKTAPIGYYARIGSIQCTVTT